jgi:hypothetical protein
MKKLTLIITLILLIIGISACERGIVEIPVVTEQPVVPVEQEPETNEVPPEVVVEFVDRVTTVPAEIQRQRQYLPGTYMLAEERPNTQNGYIFTVVVIDDYGRIAGVYIDQTITTRNLFRSPDGVYYFFLAGNRVNVPDSYRRIELTRLFQDYPTTNDAIKAKDLVVGVDTEDIRVLTRIAVNETKQMVSGRVVVAGRLSYQQQMQAVANKIVDDQSTYGFNLIEKDNVLTTNSIEGITESLSVPLSLVQSILDGPAALPEDTTLRKLDNPLYGVYEKGIYANFSPLAYENGVLVHGLSVVVVDEFGRMNGVYLDEITTSTARANVVASKQILKTAVGLSISQPLEWFEQANAVAQQVLQNQGIQGFVLATDAAVVTELSVGSPKLQITNMTNIAIRANEILLATKTNLSQALFTGYLDGTYFVSNPTSFAYVTIYNQQIEDIFVDRYVLREQAQIYRDGGVINVERIVRQFSTLVGLVDADVVVYSSGSLYYSVHDVIRVNDLLLSADQQIEADEELQLTDVELASKRPVPGWNTASSLVQVDAAQATWHSDQNKLASAIVTQGSITDFQVVDGRIPALTGIAQVPATSLLDLLADALFQARIGSIDGWSVPFVPQPVPLADGSYIVHMPPRASGAIYSTYVVVKEGRIITWVVDSTFLSNNRVSSFMLSTNPVKDDLVVVSNLLRESQTSIVPSLINKAAPDPTILSIKEVTLIDREEEIFVVSPFEELLDMYIRQATIAKQEQDVQWIHDYFSKDEAYFKNTTLLSLQNKEQWLPSSISHPQLSYSYRLNWRSEERDLNVLRTGETYSVRVARLDLDKSGILELEIFLPNVNAPISVEQFELPMRRPVTHGATVLNSKAMDLSGLILIEKTQYTLPTSNEFTISWRSSLPAVLTASGLTSSVTQPTNVDLIAFIDLDGNGLQDTNEPFRVYSLTVLPLAQALVRLRTELDTNELGSFVGNIVTLRNKSSIWGLTYTWSTDIQNVVVVGTDEDATFYIRSLDAQQNIQFTANVNVANNNIAIPYRVDAGNKLQYAQLAKLDLPLMNVDAPLYEGQSIFKDFSGVGRFYRSELTFRTSDFGRFIDASGVVIYQHPTIDACFEVDVTSKYSGGAVDSSATSSHSFCVMSLSTLQKQINEDRNQLQNYVIDLGLTTHVNTPLMLPLKSWNHQLPIRWEVLTGQDAILQYFDLTNLNSGIVVVNTTNPAITSGISLRLSATIDIVAGTPPVQTNKLVLITVLDE